MVASREQYPRALEYNSQGYALYQPKATSFIRPGDCGYFDHQGDWHNLINSLNPPDLTSPKVTVLKGELHVDKPETWGTVTGEGVSYTSAGVEGEISLPGSGRSLDIKLEFSKQQEYGAAVLTGPYVKKTYFQNIHKFHSWVKENSGFIVKNFPDVKKNDLWIITKICQTPRCVIGYWSDQQKSSLLLGGGSFVNNSLTMKVDWKREQISGAWRFFDRDDEIPEDWIIFIEGLKFRYSRGLDAMKLGPLREVDRLRGKEETFPDFVVNDADGTEYSVECEHWGDDEE